MRQASTADDNHALLAGTLSALGEGKPLGEALSAAVGRAQLAELPEDTPAAEDPPQGEPPGDARHVSLPPPRLCSVLCPVLYGAPLVRMGDAPGPAAGKAARPKSAKNK